MCHFLKACYDSQMSAENRAPDTGASWRTLQSMLCRALLFLLFALLVTGACELSYTADEPAHVAGGYALLTNGSQALEMLAQRGYPPLLPAAQALMTFLGEPRIEITQLDGWPGYFDVFSNAFVEELRTPELSPRLTRTILLSRMPSLWLAILLAALVARWGRELWGGWAGLCALLFLVIDPTFLAHARFATTDLGVMAFGTASLYTAWRWARGGGWGASLFTALLLGATLLSKISGPLWALACGFLLLLGLLRRRHADPVQALAQTATTIGISFLLLWAGYAFSLGRIGEGGLPVFAPEYWKSAFYLTQYGSLFFALGERYTGTRWWYFPLAFLIKNPLPLLIAWTLGGGLLAEFLASPRSGRRGLGGGVNRWRLSSGLAALLLFPILYSGIAVWRGMNIGYRHMLPVHPLLHLLAAGGLAGVGLSRRRVRHWAVAALALSTAVGTLRMTPNELAFFSILIGGPEAGYRYLVDSNLDWGQRSSLFERYLDANPEVLRDMPEAAFQPEPGRYIVSASWLHGVGLGDVYGYEWFRHREPAETLDATFLIYDVPPLDLAWIAQCQVPVLPLDAAAEAEGLGAERVQDMRRLGFDCSQSWLYPDGGTSAGLYVMSTELLEGDGRDFPSLLPRPPVACDSYVAQKLAPTHLSYLDERPGQAFALYEYDPSAPESPDLPPFALDRCELEGGALGHELPPGSSLAAHCNPCVLEGRLAFLGTSIDQRDEGFDVETRWQVIGGPIARNFSIMGHLLAYDGYALSTADGLGVWPMLLQEGDIFVQRHSFDAAQVGNAAWFRTGVYWLDTMALWRVGEDSDLQPQGTMIYILLDEIAADCN